MLALIPRVGASSSTCRSSWEVPGKSRDSGLLYLLLFLVLEILVVKRLVVLAADPSTYMASDKHL